jgi:hypothetical protein
MALKASELPRNFPGSSSRELREKFRLGNFRALVGVAPKAEAKTNTYGSIGDSRTDVKREYAA